MTRIKVCGLTNLEDTLLAVRLGVEVVGFIFSESPRQITVEKARKIINQLPPVVVKVGVFVDEPADFVEGVCHDLSLDMVQLHGNETIEYMDRICCPSFKAFRIGGPEDIERVKSFNRKFFLLDSSVKGQTFDWQLACRLKDYGFFFLSGGLNPENVTAALQLVKPFGVDVCSGVESYPGKKDHLKMKNFVWRVRTWDCQNLNTEYLAADLSPKP